MLAAEQYYKKQRWLSAINEAEVSIMDDAEIIMIIYCPLVTIMAIIDKWVISRL